MHVSLDGFCAGPGGEMDWIAMNETIFADATALIHTADAAVYGRAVHDMMRGYWPTMLNKPDSPQVQHARWVEEIPKLTFSRSMPGSDWNNVQIRRDVEEVFQDKQQPGKNLVIFGSPRLVHAFLALEAIDEFWIFQNPVMLGAGVPYLQGGIKTRLKLLSHKPFDNGVMRLHYAKEET
jgi:dihydrofolate reductase